MRAKQSSAADVCGTFPGSSSVVDTALLDVVRGRDLDTGRGLAAVGEPLGLTMEESRSVLATYAHRTLAERHTCRRVLLDRRGVEEAARAMGLDVSRVARRVARVLSALAHSLDHGPRSMDRNHRTPIDGDLTAVLPVAPGVRRSACTALAFLRLVHAARRPRVELAAAAAALEGLERLRLIEALEGSLGLLLDGQLPAESCVDLRPVRGLPAVELMQRVLTLGHLAGPAARRLDPFAHCGVRVECLLGMLEGMDAALAELWRSRARYALGDPREHIESARAAGASQHEVAALALDAGDPWCAAREMDGEPSKDGSPGLSELVRGACEATTRQELFRLEQRRDRSSRAPRESIKGSRGPARQRQPDRCANFGASVLVVVRLARRPGDPHEVCYLDSAAGIDVRMEALLRPAGEGADQSLRLVRLSAESWMQPLGAEGEPNSMGVDPHARWLALEPILDGQGEVMAVVRLEWRHAWLPPASVRRKLAQAWSERLSGMEFRARNLVDVTPPAARQRLGQREQHCRAAEALVARLGFGTAQRRWSLLVVRASRPVSAAGDPRSRGRSGTRGPSVD